ncbi:TetR family transcriptional regulator [Actinoplanes cyaneus]|uniref:TetR family transcriptional regulator n=1 Tax=Actinoplanes cyaneus TaxID=52696 RepID=A0A919INT0_9ACTN|nr:TetR-like C-terminal domain-containing protein [Actinoplanes cyaneus]MCW2139974.1 transcriptional regulator, TetR family [Actinoplanes cyaneus]GID67727.1 TetR family transcriptional regulator [Actinoplanes cyaneus]
MPRAGLAPAAVVDAGAALADEVGFEKLTMGLLAERLGVRTPSLYKHVESLEALRRGITLQAMRDFTDAVSRAAVGQSGAAAVRAFADAYRRWAVAHPGRYASAIRAPGDGDEDEELRQVSNELMRIMYDVLAGFELRGTHAVDAARVLRSSLHGFATVEAAGGFGLPRDVDRSYRFLVDTLVAGLQHVPVEPSGAASSREFHE